jgi:hypothetical protein
MLGFNDWVNESETQEERLLRVRKTREEIFMRQANSGVSRRRRDAASSPFCTEEGLRILMNDPFRSVRRAVAYNKRTPTSVLDDMVHDPEIHAAIAPHHNASPEALRELAKSDNPQIISMVAGNRNTPIDLLLDLLDYPDGTTRGNVKRNRTYIAWKTNN